MANIVTSITNRTSGPAGTLSSNNLMFNPNVPRASQGMGAQGADGRAYTRDVGDNELVSNQLQRLLQDPNSRYMNQARSEAQRQASTRGLGNSSIAAGSGVRAAIQSALPIAQQDAGTYAGAAEQNVNMLNQNLMQERDIGNRMLDSQMSAEAAIEAARLGSRDAEAERQFRLQLQREGYAFEGEQRGLDRGHDLTRMGYDFNLRDMFANNDVGRDLTRMGADYQWRDMFADNEAGRQDWLQGNQFNREFYGNMMNMFAQSSLNSSSDMFNMLTAYALDNPDVFNAADYQNFAGTVNNIMGQTISGIMGRLFGRGG